MKLLAVTSSAFYIKSRTRPKQNSTDTWVQNRHCHTHRSFYVCSSMLEIMTTWKSLASDRELEAWSLGALQLDCTGVLQILLGSGGLVRVSGLTLKKFHRSLQHSLVIESRVGTAVVRVC